MLNGRSIQGTNKVSERNQNRFVSGLLCGALLGVAVAMFVAPETRASEHASESSSDDPLARGREIFARARARVDDAITHGRMAAEQQRRSLSGED